MRSQFINCCGYGGDITQAQNRLGINSALICIRGGTASTAIKLQHCDTATGSYTDYIELVSSAKASSDTMVGVFVDLTGAKKYLKVSGAIAADVIFGDCDFNPKDIQTIGTPSGGGDVDLEDNKAATINVSAYTVPVEITPTEGKDGMKKATITLSNIPSSEKTLYAFGTAEAVVYLLAIPAEDTESVTAYVPSVAGLTETTAAYTTESGVTISDVSYTRYDTGDLII